MTDTENETIDSSNDTVEELNINLDNTSGEVDVDALIEQNKKLFERAKKAETKLKEQKPPAKPITNEPKTYDIPDEVLDLRLEGYSKSDVEFIMRNGGKKALEDKNSLTYIAIQNKREQEKAERAASQTVDNSSQSEVERKFTHEQLRNMSAKELAEILPHA